MSASTPKFDRYQRLFVTCELFDGIVYVLNDGYKIGSFYPRTSKGTFPATQEEFDRVCETFLDSPAYSEMKNKN